jgi:hypothetical protein
LISVEVSMRASACIDGTKPDRAVATLPRAATTQPQSSAEALRCAMLAYLDDTSDDNDTNPTSREPFSVIAKGRRCNRPIGRWTRGAYVREPVLRHGSGSS